MDVVLLAHYVVRDQVEFLEAFDAFGEQRTAAGVTDCALVVSDADPRRLVAVLKFGSRASAEAFASSPQRLAALERGGVMSRNDEIHEILRPFSRGVA
ncbi:MAG: hypothetical protein AB7I08_15240 [Thermoleophilia bacterium]